VSVFFHPFLPEGQRNKPASVCAVLLDAGLDRFEGIVGWFPEVELVKSAAL